MSIRRLPNVSSSLNAGLIYALDYGFEPQGGATITLHYVSTSGQYLRPPYLSGAIITIGGASFRMLVLSSRLNETAASKTLEVTFVDSTYLLDNYYIALKDRGCGTGVFELGDPVDEDGADLTAFEQRIKNLTQFPDVQYTFNDFLRILRQCFPTNAPSVDPAIKGAYTGTVREVLNAWCSYLGFAYYFENSSLVITPPKQIALPGRPAGALTFSHEINYENTFTKTAFTYVQLEGGEISLSAETPVVEADPVVNEGNEPTVPNETEGGESNTDGKTNNYIQYKTLYPYGYEFDVNEQAQAVDINQVIAAQYGEMFWLVYNYYKGSAAQECGWNKVLELPADCTITQSVSTILNGRSGGIVNIDQDYFTERFQMYKEYGERIAGRYYLSPPQNNIAEAQSFTWYDSSQGQTFSIDVLKEKSPLGVQYLTQGTVAAAYLDGTEINKYFPGLVVQDNRIVYYDAYDMQLKTKFVLTADQKKQIESAYAFLMQGIFGSKNLDYSCLTTDKQYIAYVEPTLNFNTETLVENMVSAGIFNPRLTTWPIQGLSSAVATLNATPFQITEDEVEQQENPSVSIQNPAVTGTTDVQNTTTIQPSNAEDPIIYYSKYTRCGFKSTNSAQAFKRVFTQRDISVDTPIDYTVNKLNRQTAQVNRDLSQVNDYFNSQILSTLAEPQLIPLESVSFSFNHLDWGVPLNFLSAGLTSMNLSIGDNGLSASYTYSNSMYIIPPSDAYLDKLERNMRNSWIRQQKVRKTAQD